MANLPCHSRHPIEGSDTEFYCSNPWVMARDGVVTLGVCRACGLSGRPAPAHPRSPAPGPPWDGEGCAHRGDRIDVAVPTPDGDRIAVAVYRCRHPAHLYTTPHACRECHDQKPPPAPDGVRRVRLELRRE